MCHDHGMHVLLVTAESDAPRPPAGGRTDASGALADVWRDAAPHCVVERLELPASAAPERTAAPVPGAAAERPAVLVPMTELGLRSVASAPAAPHLARLADRVGAADLVVVHVDVLDTAALHAGPVADSAAAAAAHAVPVVVLTGADLTSRRAVAAAGVAGVHDVGAPWDAGRLARVAQTWCPPRRPV
jgi:hypothetical protein